MASSEQSPFSCPVCDIRAAPEWVAYDGLGYAICPACDESVRPA